MKQGIVIALMVLAAIAVIYGLWLAGKWINYKLAYESGVTATIQEMVKPECLKESGQ